MKKLVYCESCDAEFRITHNMDKRLYKILHCPFCGDDLNEENEDLLEEYEDCLLYTSPSPRDPHLSRMPSSA